MKLHGSIKLGNGTYSLSVPVLNFKEDDVEVLYAPSLEITGYGNTYAEAKESLKICVEEFLRYIHNKKTIDAVLLNLGWKRLKSKSFRAPENTDLIVKNSLYSDIVNNKEYKSYNEELSLAIQ